MYHGVGGEYGDYGVDINSVIDDVRIWRVAINGYPYQTPESLGVENKYDAFVATKQSIYSILYGTDVNSYYNGADERGNKIKNAIIRLVDIGRNGTQTPSNTDIDVRKQGRFYEDGDYYSQNYSINSPVETSQYTITSTANLPVGSKITDLSNNEKSTFGGTEQFKIKIPKSQLSSDINVNVVVRAKCKTYPVFYGNTRIPGTQDYLITYDPFGDTVGITNLEVSTNTGSIKINKTDNETSQAIEGVTFQLKKQDGTVISNATTNDNGVATFSGLYQGNYVLKEVSTNENYVLNNAEFNVNVEYNKQTVKDVTNEHKRGNLKIFKADKDNNKIALGNVQFDLYSEEFQRVIGTYTTNVDGEIEIKNLRIGEYKLIEKNTGKWYNLAEDTEIEIEWEKERPVTIQNELKKGQVKVVKVDVDNNEVKLEGVKFDVLDEKGNVLETITTDENGTAYTSRYAVRDYSKLIIKEKETLQNYVLNEESQTIILKANEITTATFENELKKGQVKVVKVDKDNTEVKLKDIKFNVIDEDGNIVDKLITDNNGEAISKKLRIDKKYTIQETETLQDYVLTEETQTITLEQDQIKNITFENEKKKGQVKIIKVDAENNEVLLEGVTFEILDSKENIVDTIITDKNGEALSKRLPIDDEYIVREKETRIEYVLTEKTQTITLEQDQIKDITFENEKIKGNIKLTKVDKDYPENKLTGAVFHIFEDTNNNEKYDKEDRFVGDIEETEIGNYEIGNLDYGRYFVKEIVAPNNFLLDKNYYEIFIEENDKTYNIENQTGKGFVNECMNGNLKITKTSSDGKVKDFNFKITGKTVTGESFEKIYTTDNNGEIYIENLRIGEYTIEEIEDDMSKKYIIPDSQIITIENNNTKEIEFFNQLIEIPQTRR